MFNSVDVSNTGKIELERWLSFWEEVYGSGHTEAEILEELSNISAGASWEGFGTVILRHNDPSISKSLVEREHELSGQQ